MGRFQIEVGGDDILLEEFEYLVMEESQQGTRNRAEQDASVTSCLLRKLKTSFKGEVSNNEDIMFDDTRGYYDRKNSMRTRHAEERWEQNIYL